MARFAEDRGGPVRYSERMDMRVTGKDFLTIKPVMLPVKTVSALYAKSKSEISGG